MEVIHEGVLAIGHNPASSSSKDWKQRLCVLKLHKGTQRATLDFYKDQKKRWQKQIPKGILSLWPSFTISLAHECGYNFPMKLVTAEEQVIYLTASNFQQMSDWYHHIQMLKVLDPPKKGCYEYEVIAQESESMNLIEANGKCLLVLTPQNQIVCATLTTRHVLGVWPYDSLRRYWCGVSTFGFEAGRRSPRGEGLFTFGTVREEELYRTLEKCIMKAKKGSSKRPPAPLPSNPNSSDTPPVSTSESDDDEAPLSVPSRTPTTGRSQTVKRKTNDSEVSTPSPAYLRRMKTHTGLVAEHKWLHKSVNPQPSSKMYEPPPNIRNEQGTEDTYSHTVHKPPPTVRNDDDPEDTYSHTVHNLPPPFLPREQTSTNKLTYQRLHSQPNLMPTGAAYSDLPEEDMRLYDVAFQPGTQATRVHTNSQYTTLGQPGPVSTSLVAESSSLYTIPRVCSDDYLTSNPLYGSQENLLSDSQTEMLRAALDKFEEQTKEMGDPSSKLAPEPSMDSVDVGGGELDDSDLQINPLYGPLSTASVASQPDKLYPLNPNYAIHSLDQLPESMDKESVDKESVDKESVDKESVDKESVDKESVGKEGENHCTNINNDKEILKGDSIAESTLPAQSEVIVGESVKRDGKGYSKVDKSKQTNRDNETPPPIPDRCYSYDGFDIISDS